MNHNSPHLYLVPCDEVKTLWPLVEGWIMAAAEVAMEEDEYSIVGQILTGEYKLFIFYLGEVPVGAMTVYVVDFPIKRAALIVHLGGEFPHIVKCLGDFESWARAMGADTIQLNGRRGWRKRLPQLGFKETFVTMEKSLWADQQHSQTPCRNSWPLTSPTS